MGSRAILGKHMGLGFTPAGSFLLSKAAGVGGQATEGQRETVL